MTHFGRDTSHMSMTHFGRDMSHMVMTHLFLVSHLVLGYGVPFHCVVLVVADFECHTIRVIYILFGQCICTTNLWVTLYTLYFVTYFGHTVFGFEIFGFVTYNTSLPPLKARPESL